MQKDLGTEKNSISFAYINIKCLLKPQKKVLANLRPF